MRLEINSADDLEKLSADLRSGPSTEVSSQPLKNGRISILIESPRHNATPLLAYRDVKRIVSDHGAKLLDVVWGANPDAFGEEDLFHWFCGDPFGALRAADLEKSAAAKPAANATKS